MSIDLIISIDIVIQKKITWWYDLVGQLEGNMVFRLIEYGNMRITDLIGNCKAKDQYLRNGHPKQDDHWAYIPEDVEEFFDDETQHCY